MRINAVVVQTVAIAIVTFGSVAVVAAPGAQAVPSALCSDGIAAARDSSADGGAEALDWAVMQLRRSGKSQAEVDATLATQHGIQLISEPADDGPAPMSADSIIGVPRPSIYRDTCTGRYYAIATWRFNNLSALRSDGGCTATCNVGGYDAFAISFSRTVSSVAGYSATAWGASSTFPSFSLTMVSGSTAGVAARGQDRLCGGAGCGALDYNMYNGQIVYSINTPGCGELQAFSEYTHTWAGAAITGIGVGVDSISVSWSPTNKGWDVGSQPSTVVRPC